MWQTTYEWHCLLSLGNSLGLQVSHKSHWHSLWTKKSGCQLQWQICPCWCSILSIIVICTSKLRFICRTLLRATFMPVEATPQKSIPLSCVDSFQVDILRPQRALQDSPSSAKVRRVRLLPRLWHQWTFCDRNQLIFRPHKNQRNHETFPFSEKLESLATLDLQWFAASLQLNLQNATLASQEALFTQLLRITHQAKKDTSGKSAEGSKIQSESKAATTRGGSNFERMEPS